MAEIQLWPGWQVVREIGRGSYGKVYEIQRRTGSYLERAALKVIRVPSDTLELEQLRLNGLGKEDTEGYLKQYVERILGEISLMQRFVGYSNIVSYEDYLINRHGNALCWDILIRMELLTPLSEYMSVKSLAERDVVKLGIDISQALVICHGAGIIHRDIKPQNIFVNDRGFFKLGDFGISRTMPGSGSVLSFKGTVSYMAPETFGMHGTDARSDIYSLALVLYRILNGNREPFLSSSRFTPVEQDAAQRRRLSGEPLPRPAKCGEPLWKVLAIALDPNPDKRYQSAARFQEALQRALLGGRPAAGSRDRTFPYEAGKEGIPAGQGGGLQSGHPPAERRGRRLLVGILAASISILIFCLFSLAVSPQLKKGKNAAEEMATRQEGSMQTGMQQESLKAQDARPDESDPGGRQDLMAFDNGAYFGDSGSGMEDAGGGDMNAGAEPQQTGYSARETSASSMAEFVEYTVICQDEEGNILDMETDSEIRGKEIAVAAPEIEGYTPLKQTDSLYISGNEDENVVLFVYSAGKEIPSDALHYNGHSYYAFVSSDIDSYWEAVSLCESLGGYMAVIGSPEENKALYDYVFHQLGYKSAYFGYTDDGSEGSWYWVGTEASGYENWLDGQPDNKKHGTKTEDYALFFYHDTPYKWNDGDFGPDHDGNVVFLIEWEG